MSVEFTSARAFASVGNVGVGFDCLGLALNGPADTVTVRRANRKGVFIDKITGDFGRLPLQTDKNVCGVVMTAMLEKLRIDGGFNVELTKGLPLNSGLGSSAASSAAAAMALNELLGRPFTRLELLPFAMLGEKAACGTAHADNVAPALLGGMILIRSDSKPDVIKIAVPKDYHVACVRAEIDVPTSEARQIIPDEISISTAIEQWRNLAAFIAALEKGDDELLKDSCVDFIAEPYRKRLIPHFDEIKEKALSAGSLCCSISGSGPTIFAICRGKKKTEAVRDVMAGIYLRNNIKAQSFVSAVNKGGAETISAE